MKGVTLRDFIYAFWAVFWRSAIILIVNAVILHGAAQLMHLLFLQTDTSVKIRLSLSHLPAAVFFALLALRHSVSGTLTTHNPSPVWRNVYLALAGASALIIIAKMGAAYSFATETWIMTGMLLPPFLFLVLWLALAIYLMRSRQKPGTTMATGA